jgi:hypothetical protein
MHESLQRSSINSTLIGKRKVSESYHPRDITYCPEWEWKPGLVERGHDWTRKLLHVSSEDRGVAKWPVYA